MNSIDGDGIAELDSAGLRRFALVTGSLLMGLFGVLLPTLLARPYPHWPWLGGGVLLAWASLAPRSLRPLYRAWTHLGLRLNRITNPFVLSLVFIVAITPLALLFKLVGRDALSRKLRSDVASYRVTSTPITKDDMRRPF
jgi:hypothetical protein